MTQRGIKEYVQAVGGRYYPASKQEKGMILGEFTKVVGCYGKAAISLIRRRARPKVQERWGGHQQDRPAVADALKGAWVDTFACLIGL